MGTNRFIRPPGLRAACQRGGRQKDNSEGSWSWISNYSGSQGGQWACWHHGVMVAGWRLARREVAKKGHEPSFLDLRARLAEEI